MSKNIFEVFSQNVEKYPNKIALIFEDKTFSYSDLLKQVSALSACLTQYGVKKGDKIGVLLPNCSEFVVLMLVAAKLGLTLVPQNTTLSAKTIFSTFDSTDVTFVFAWYSLISELKEIKNNFSLWMSIGGSCIETLNYDDVIFKEQPEVGKTDSISVDQPYILTMTSGSTSDPKPILLLQGTKIIRAKSAIDNYKITKDDVILAATPLYHSLAERLVLIPLLCGATSLLMAGFTPKEWLEKVTKFHVTFTMAVSSQLKRIYNEMDNLDYQIDSLRCLVSSSELLDVNLKKALIQKFDCDFHECYGTSEVACVTNIASTERLKNSSVGAPLPEVEIKILKDDKTIAKVGEVGEIICKTPMLFAGYYNLPEITENSMWNGYFCTGDLGKLDDDGYLYFQGRKKDIIVTGGINIYPKDIEYILKKHPKVKDCTVIPLPDEKLGEMVTAIIVTDGEIIHTRDLQRLCAKELADFQQPRRFIMANDLPKNAMGKILKRELIDQYS